MKSLIIDTSHDTSYIILTKDCKVIFIKKIEKIRLSKELLPTLDRILKETNTDISSLKYIATSIGPGSFTGLRVGATICKTFSYAKNIPLIGYVSLEAYLPFQEGKFISAFDAKSQGIFALEGCLKDNKISYVSQPKLLNLDEAKKLFDESFYIISPDAEILKSKFVDFKNKIYTSSFDPNKVIHLTKNLYYNKKFTDYKSFNLLYLKGPNHIE